MEQTWHLLQADARTAAENMAVDELLLESAAQLGGPLLRFYGWSESAASFGYFQKYSEVQRMTRLRPLVRRPTGGGLVPHDADWTYSLIFPPTDPWYALKAVESYRRVHEWIQASFAQIGQVTELSPLRCQEQPGQCFVGAERFDLLRQGRKIAGAAQRRTRHGLLIQGSIQPPPAGMPRAGWETALCEAARAAWGIQWAPFEISPALETRIAQLAEQKYSRPEYNERR